MQTNGISSNLTSYQMIATRVDSFRASPTIACTIKQLRVFSRNQRCIFRYRCVINSISPTHKLLKKYSNSNTSQLATYIHLRRILTRLDRFRSVACHRRVYSCRETTKNVVAHFFCLTLCCININY